jgi:hypothetical protein
MWWLIQTVCTGVGMAVIVIGLVLAFVKPRG